MKTKFLGILLMGAIIFSCKKDDEPTTPTTFDNHSSPLMVRMHSMSDSMAMMQMTGDPDLDFMMMMTMHHRAAIDMAQYELYNGNDSVIRNLSQTMKDAQVREIQIMDSIMMNHNPMPITTDFSNKAEHAMHLMHINADAQTLNGDADHDIAHLMMPHHQSAIEMSRAEIESGQIQLVKDLAQQMINSQQMELNSLQIWLNSNN